MSRNWSARKALFPYGMERNPDGSWTFFNRHYKPVGLITDDWAEWDVPQHKLFLKGVGPATLKKLDLEGKGGDRIFFYNDATIPERSAANMSAYLAKLEIVLKLKAEIR